MVGYLAGIGHKGKISKTQLVMRPFRGSSVLLIRTHLHGQQNRGLSDPVAKLPLVA